MPRPVRFVMLLWGALCMQLLVAQLCPRPKHCTPQPSTLGSWLGTLMLLRRLGRSLCLALCMQWCADQWAVRHSCTQCHSPVAPPCAGRTTPRHIAPRGSNDALESIAPACRCGTTWPTKTLAHSMKMASRTARYGHTSTTLPLSSPEVADRVSMVALGLHAALATPRRSGKCFTGAGHDDVPSAATARGRRRGAAA